MDPVPRIQTMNGTANDPIDGSPNDCWEHVPQHIMAGVAGGLKHGMTLLECQCLCANSAASGKYSFKCKSAQWYQTGDCVLNLHHKGSRPYLFRAAEDGRKMTYLGLICPDEGTFTLL